MIHRPATATAILMLTVFTGIGLAGEPMAPSTSSAMPAGALRLSVGEPSHMFDSASARGSYLAIHVIPSKSAAGVSAFTRDLLERAPMLAGVRHVVILSGSAEDASRAIETAIKDAGESARTLLYHDASGTALGTLNIPPTGGLVVLDPAGAESFRIIAPASHPSISQLNKRIGELTSDKASVEANLMGGLALGGYDPVSYIDQNKPTEGDRRLTSMHRGITYRFATAENREKFNAQPDKYVPAYGGWCATAMANGEKVEIDPMNYKVTSGRLFLFYKGFFGNALNDWKKDEPGLTIKADEHWNMLTVPSDAPRPSEGTTR